LSDTNFPACGIAQVRRREIRYCPHFPDEGLAMIIVSAFRRVPPFAQGLVRDLRVRWALEEAGLRYEVTLLEDGEKDGADYRAWQPFGQVPAYEENG
jgi:hypothetical protein